MVRVNTGFRQRYNSLRLTSMVAKPASGFGLHSFASEHGCAGCVRKPGCDSRMKHTDETTMSAITRTVMPKPSCAK